MRGVDNTMTINRRLPVTQKLGYGLGAIAYSLPNQVMASFFLFYATSILHIDSSIAGMIVATSVLWDAVTDPWVGHISDRTFSERYGRRHLYLIIGGIGTAVGTALLWSIPSEESNFYKITALLMFVLFTKTALTFYGAPYFAIGGALSNGYDERSSVQSYRAAFHVLGMVIAAVGITMFFFKSTDSYPKGQLNPHVYPLIGYSVALITLLFSFIAVVLIPKDKTKPRESDLLQKINVLQSAINSLKNSNLRTIIFMIFLIEIAFQISISIGLHVSTYTYNLSGPQIGLIGATILIFSLLSQPFWVYVSRKLEKKTALIIGMIFGVFGFAGLPMMFVGLGWLPLNDISTVPLMMGFSMLSGVGNGAFMSLPFSMVADTVDQDEVITGMRQEGLYFGMYNFSYKSGISISVLLGGILLDYVGFDPTMPEQTASTAYNLAMVPMWMLIIISPIIYWSISKYQLSRKQHHNILRKLNVSK